MKIAELPQPDLTMPSVAPDGPEGAHYYRATTVQRLLAEQYAATERALHVALSDAQMVNDRLREALAWYADESRALAKNMTDGAHTQAVLASVAVLALDAGQRADVALKA